jgi:hypothetical protein
MDLFNFNLKDIYRSAFLWGWGRPKIVFHRDRTHSRRPWGLPNTVHTVYFPNAETYVLIAIATTIPTVIVIRSLCLKISVSGWHSRTQHINCLQNALIRRHVSAHTIAIFRPQTDARTDHWSLHCTGCQQNTSPLQRRICYYCII